MYPRIQFLEMVLKTCATGDFEATRSAGTLCDLKFRFLTPEVEEYSQKNIMMDGIEGNYKNQHSTSRSG